MRSRREPGFKGLGMGSRWGSSERRTLPALEGQEPAPDGTAEAAAQLRWKNNSPGRWLINSACDFAQEEELGASRIPRV